MAKLGVITDGISREFDHALSVMNECGLTQAELQFIWDKEVGDLTDAQLDRVQQLVAAHEVEVSCISRLIFGSNGAEQWNVARGAWDKLVVLVAPAVQIAEDRGITLVVETGNNAMITSAWLGRKLIDELGSDRLKLLWDPANSLYCTEIPFPDGYEALRGGYLGHIHLKDVVVDIARATLTCKPLGEGGMGPYLAQIAGALAADGYTGSISLESVYRPQGGSFEDGFRASVGLLQELFG